VRQKPYLTGGESREVIDKRAYVLSRAKDYPRLAEFHGMNKERVLRKMPRNVHSIGGVNI